MDTGRQDSTKYGAVSPELISLLERFLEVIRGSAPALPEVRKAMLELLEYLATPAGRTDANCTATDNAIGADNDWHFDWKGLPESYVAVISDMAGGLHDTVSAPEIAENFESTPEQLLQRARDL